MSSESKSPSEPQAKRVKVKSDDSDSQQSLQELSLSILRMLRDRQPVTVEGVDPALHYLPPYVPKFNWNQVGDLVSQIEKNPPASGKVPGERWISLRLDGTCFSKVVRMLRKKGILEPQGFSARFADCMKNCCEALMAHFNAKIGYTQSDEMVVFIAPASIVRGVQQQHERGGRVGKLTTLAASFVSVRFALQLAQLCQEFKVDLSELLAASPHFDCRLGHYSCWEEAQALLMWRAYDSSVNGVSDAVHHSGIAGAKKVNKGNTKERLVWLKQQGRLPLPPHQACGTMLVKVKRLREGFNPRSNTVVHVLRGTIERTEGVHILELVRSGSVWRADDVPPSEGGSKAIQGSSKATERGS